MQPEFQQPTFQSPSEPPKSTSHKKLIIIVAIVVALLVAGGVYALLFMKSSQQPQDKSSYTAKENTSKTVEFSHTDNATSYAGNKMYDACNLIPIKLLKTHIEKYDETFNSMSSDRHLKDPLVIDHGYVDRTIPKVLGEDNTAREPGVGISESGVDTSVRAKSFASIMDSHCTYAQGSNFDSEFADIYVIQPPQLLHPKLVAYLDDLKQKGKMAIESQGVQVYVEPVQAGDTTYTLIFRKENTVVILDSLQQTLTQAASEEVVNILAKEPTGPATITYPSFYSKLTNTCTLLSASDFERLLGKPASALATETWTITESEKDTATRTCSRIEVERFKQAEISSTQISLSESRTEEQTKSRLLAIKNDSDNVVTSIENLGDESYIVARGATASAQRSIVIRVGKVLLTVESSGEAKDRTTDNFSSRTLPIAKIVLSNYKK